MYLNNKYQLDFVNTFKYSEILTLYVYRKVRTNNNN